MHSHSRSPGELVLLCPIHNCEGECIEATSFAITPEVGPVGETITGTAEFNVYNRTGTGEVQVGILYPDGAEDFAGFLNTGYEPGNYTFSFTLSTENHPDKTSDTTPTFIPGKYHINLSFCEGECGSKHPWSHTFDTIGHNFTLHKK